MVSTYKTPAQQTELVNALEQLDQQCRQVIGAEPSAAFRKVPAKNKWAKGDDATGKQLVKNMHLIWQMAFAAGGHVKGPPPMHGIKDNMWNLLAGEGGKTHKYPIEALQPQST